jgi:fructose-1,6-bisphosphatase/inositol monophosphatase family enzyme
MSDVPITAPLPSDAVNMGVLNGHSVGRILKEAVRRAASVIRAERQTFEQHTKKGYGGSMDDVFTSADRAAQEVYLRTFRECFPGCGVLGEEDSLSIAAEAPITAYFTVDPIDGTRAFIRRQSHGISTMVALVDQGEVISAYVGDVSSNEVYGYRPGSSRVHRITNLDAFETLTPRDVCPSGIGEIHGLLRDPPDMYSPATQALVKKFKNYEIMGSSIGTWAARQWKGEVGAVIYDAGYETPWDTTPVIGITKKLGLAWLRPVGDAWLEYEPALPLKPTMRDHDALVIHSACVENGRLKF